MGKTLYVGNLSYSVDEAELRRAFEPFGPVSSARVVMDHMTERSRGFGFVDMETDDAAEAAIEGMNGQEHMGRTLTVNEARPRTDRGPSDRGGFGGGGSGRF